MDIFYLVRSKKNIFVKNYCIKLDTTSSISLSTGKIHREEKTKKLKIFQLATWVNSIEI